MKLAPFIIVATAALLPRYVDAQAAPRDPYSCYRAKTGDSGIRFTAKFTDPLRSGIHLDDAFGETTFGVRKLEWACTAAAVGQGSVADPDSGFLGYRLRRIRKRCAPGAFNELESCTERADTGSLSDSSSHCGRSLDTWKQSRSHRPARTATRLGRGPRGDCWSCPEFR